MRGTLAPGRSADDARTSNDSSHYLTLPSASSSQRQKENMLAEPTTNKRVVLNLKAGDWVEVRSREEILATLDEHGRLDSMPFMPEMIQYCGQRFRVSKRADKTCQYIVGWSIRRVRDSVHLENARCDGNGHDGCEAGCLIFWKEAWLKRADKDDLVAAETLRRKGASSAPSNGLCTIESILAASRTSNADGETVYSCQETEVYKFSSHMKAWDLRQYLRDLRSGNLSSGLAGDSRGHRVLEMVLGVMKILNAAIIGLYNDLQARNHGVFYPLVAGYLEKTPLEVLNLQVGEFVQVRSKDEIMATLDRQNRNRGLLFDFEMLTYCGGIFRVLRRVDRIIDAKTGKMQSMKYPCIILEGVTCRSDYHRLCPRAIYHYWRENWLMRAADVPIRAAAEQMVETRQ